MKQKPSKKQAPVVASKKRHDPSRTAANKARHIARAEAQRAKHYLRHGAMRSAKRAEMVPQSEAVREERVKYEIQTRLIWQYADSRGISTGAAEALLSGNIDKGEVLEQRQANALLRVELVRFNDGVREVRVVHVPSARVLKCKGFLKVIGRKQVIQGPVPAQKYFNEVRV